MFWKNPRQSSEEVTPARIFVAGVMQGSHREAVLHAQEYRRALVELLERHFPKAEVYDPLAGHRQSLGYDERRGREVFLAHNAMCAEADLLVAYLPTASMGTAIEMWEAFRHGALIVSISPMEHNWAVKFLSHLLYPDIDGFAEALARGEPQAAYPRERRRMVFLGQAQRND